MTVGRDRMAGWLRIAARVAFLALVAVMPFRWRIDPLPHPLTDLPAVLNDVVIYAIDGLAVATVGLWLLAGVLDRRPIDLGPRWLRVPVAILLILGWATAPFGLDPYLSVLGALRLTAGIVLALYVLNTVSGVAALAVPVGLMVVTQALVAIGQAAVQGSIGLAGIGELRLDPAAAGTSVVQLDVGTRILRAYGLSTHPNVLGGFFAVGILLLLAARPERLVGRALQATSIALGAAAIVLTFSRGSWLGLAVGLAVGLVVLGRRDMAGERRRWLSIGALALVALVVVGWQVRASLATRTGLIPIATATEERSIDERVAQIELGWRVFLADPVTGTGMSAVPIAMERLDPRFEFSFYAPHLVPLVVADETGIAGGIAFIGLLAIPWVLLWRSRRAWNGELAAASGALAAITVAGLFDDYPWVGGPGRTLAWFVLGVWALAWTRARLRAEDGAEARVTAVGPGRTTPGPASVVPARALDGR